MTQPAKQRPGKRRVQKEYSQTYDSRVGLVHSGAQGGGGQREGSSSGVTWGQGKEQG